MIIRFYRLAKDKITSYHIPVMSLNHAVCSVAVFCKLYMREIHATCMHFVNNRAILNTPIPHPPFLIGNCGMSVSSDMTWHLQLKEMLSELTK